jgi:hypothetical protein
MLISNEYESVGISSLHVYIAASLTWDKQNCSPRSDTVRRERTKQQIIIRMRNPCTKQYTSIWGSRTNHKKDTLPGECPHEYRGN